MISERCLNRLAMSLVLMILLCPGAQLVMCQDSAGTWKDDATGLIWSVKDNGFDTSWVQASNYCKNLALGGYTDWRLPTQKELETIYDKSLSKELKAKNPIELKGENVWAESTDSGDAWMLNFLNGGTSLLPTGGSCGGGGRALCVRRSGK
jgi:hypothetical protein